MNLSQTTNDGQILSPLERLKEMNKAKRADLENSLLKEALAQSSENCNKLICKQNTLIEGLTTSVNSLESANAHNANELRGSVSNAVIAMKNLQNETRSLNNKVATETSYAIKRATTTLENELRSSIAVQSQEVFTEVRKELDESKKLLQATREELKLQGKFRKIMFWATPAIMLLQTVLLIFLSVR